MKKLKEEAQLKNKKKLNHWALLVIFGLILAVVGRIVVANQLVAVSNNLAQIETEKVRLEKENLNLTKSLGLVESPAHLQSKAKELGFAPAGNKIIYGTKNSQLAASIP